MPTAINVQPVLLLNKPVYNILVIIPSLAKLTLVGCCYMISHPQGADRLMARVDQDSHESQSPPPNSGQMSMVSHCRTRSGNATHTILQC